MAEKSTKTQEANGSGWRAPLDAVQKLPALINHPWVRFGAVAGLIGLIGALLLILDLDGDLSPLDANVASGSAEGNYHAIVDELAEEAAALGGTIANVPSNGSVDNVDRLSAGCEVDFALVQDGVPVADDAGIELIGRLPRSESLFFVGADADNLTRFEQMRGFTVGVGAEGSGTAHVTRAILQERGFSDLGLKLKTYPSFTAQRDALESGEIRLAAFIIDEDSAFIRETIADKKLQIAAFEHMDVIARTMPFARTGRIGAGQYDPVALYPPADRRVLRIDTLVVANDCASHSERIAMLRLLQAHDANFVHHNKETASGSPIPLDPTAGEFYENGGAGFVDEYFPWFVDIMPLGNWVYLVMCVSVLFNIMGAGHRFRLWRIDANRVRLEALLHKLFGAHTTLVEIDNMEIQEHQRSEEFLTQIDGAIVELRSLIDRLRTQAVSLLVPMGAELTYRYQEHTIADTIDTLHRFQSRARSVPSESRATTSDALDPVDDGEGDDDVDRDDDGEDSEA